MKTQKIMSQQFILLITASPLKTQAHITAMAFIQSCLDQNVAIKNIFFYQDAVLVASRLASPPSDEPLLSVRWQQLLERAQKENQSFELQTCVAASYRRGIIDQLQADETNADYANLHPSFSITGLGQLAAALSDPSNKLIHFN